MDRHQGRAGNGAITAVAVAGRTVLSRLHAESPLRFVQPTFPAAANSASVCIVTFGGGLVDGDEVSIDLAVEAGATLVVFTQSTTKVFRGSSRQTFRAKVDGTLIFLPDPVAAFADAHYTQRVDVELGPSGSCVLLDGFTSGRPAFGERWAMRGLDLRTTVTRDRRALVTDALCLDASQTGSFEAFATLVAIGRGVLPIVSSIERDAATPPTKDLVLANSSLPRCQNHSVGGGAILRVAASSPSRALAAIRSRLRNLPDIDAVDPFASRY